MITPYYMKIPGAAPPHDEQRNLTLNGGNRSIGRIRRDGAFQPSIHSEAIPLTAILDIANLAMRFLEHGKDGIPEVEEVKVF